MFWERPQWAEKFGGSYLSLFALFMSGTLITFFLVFFLSIPQKNGLRNKIVQTAALFTFGLFSAFYLSVIPGAAIAPAFINTDMRGAAFLLFAVGAGMEAAELSRGFTRERVKLNTNALSAACLCAAAAILDNLLVAAFFLPFIPFRRLYAMVHIIVSDEEIELADKVRDMQEIIREKTLELRNLKDSAADETRENPEFWLLPNLSDDIVAAQLRG